MNNHECTQGDRISAIERAMFGDEKLGIKGDHQMIQEMHKVLVEGGAVKKTLIWVFSTAIAIGGAILMYFQILKEFKE